MSSICSLDQLVTYLVKSGGYLFSIIFGGSLFAVPPLGADKEAEGLVARDIDVEIVVVSNEFLSGDTGGGVGIHEGQQFGLQSLFGLVPFFELLEFRWSKSRI